MIDDSKIKDILAKLTDDDIFYLWTLSQEHIYDSVHQAREWNEEDEFWRQVGYEGRLRG